MEGLIEESLDSLTGAQWFSTMDTMASEYNQVPITEKLPFALQCTWNFPEADAKDLWRPTGSVSTSLP